MENEIAWHEANKSNYPTIGERGFIRGLRQAKQLIEKAQAIVNEDKSEDSLSDYQDALRKLVDELTEAVDTLEHEGSYPNQSKHIRETLTSIKPLLEG